MRRKEEEAAVRSRAGERVQVKVTDHGDGGHNGNGKEKPDM